MSAIICLGHSTLDTVYRVHELPLAPTKIMANDCVEVGGGMAANASVAAARLGASARYWGRVGEDAVGERIIAMLEEEGVGPNAVRRIASARSPCSAVLVDDEGERLICSFNDPALDENAGWLPVDSLAGVDVVLADVRWLAGARRLFAAARANGIHTVLDADVAPADTLRELCSACDYALFSEAGLSVASGTPKPLDGLRKMQQLVSGLVGVTLGAEGFLWLEKGHERRTRAPQVAAVDTLGAGDVFHGAFAVAIAEGRAVSDAAAFANAAAALKCTRFGGRLGAPSRRAVDVLLADSRET